MLESEQPAFIELLGDLFGAHSRNVKADMAGGYWKGLRRMTLEEFRACVEASIEKLQFSERGVAHPPTVAELWDLYRGLKRKDAAASYSLEAPKDHGLDAWDRAANLLLLAYFTRSLHDKSRSKTGALVYDATRYAPDSHYGGYPGPRTQAIAAIFARYKGEWARDMRADRERGGNTDGKLVWLEYMEIAEHEVTALEANQRAAA